MTDCNPCSTPVDTQGKLSEAEGPPCQIPLHTGVLQVPFSTSPSPGRTSPTLFSRSVFTCMIPESLTSLLSSAFSATSGARSTTAYSFTGPPPPTLSSTLTPTGQDVQTLGAPSPAMMSS
jgi:hypothetical protein